MGASESNLSAAGYGYDYVVTVSQISINATALAYLSDRQPAVNVCYVYDANLNPVQIDYQELIRRAKGTDPFRVPESGPEHDTALKNLDDANFVFGFSAAMGLPAGVPVASLPDVVTLGGSAEVPVVYRLFCRTFQLVELQQRPHNAPPGWRTWSQPSGQMWLFTYDVPLIAGTVENTATFVGTAPFDNLPQKRAAEGVGPTGGLHHQAPALRLRPRLGHHPPRDQRCRPRPEGEARGGLLDRVLRRAAGDLDAGGGGDPVVVGRPVRRTADGVRDQSERGRSARHDARLPVRGGRQHPCRPPNRSPGTGWTRSRSGTSTGCAW